MTLAAREPIRPVGDLLRELAPQVLGAIVRRYGNFDLAEDATQEALIAAAERWPVDGVPASPKGWLVTVASRRLTDALRSRQARRRREDTVHYWSLAQPASAVPGEEPAGAVDDSLVLLFLACHPSLSPASQIALTLRAVGGLSTSEIARAFLVPEATMTRRITRAKQSIKQSGEPFRIPAATERRERLDAVLHTLYLIFNEGYAATAGPGPHRVELSKEAIRLARMVCRQLPGDAESAGLLALMLLTDARRPARTTADGTIVPMAEQDRSLWDRAAIDEGTSLLQETLRAGEIGPYQIQATIAALHDEAVTADDTDWPQILELYELLLDAQPNPVVALNHAVALAMVEGPQAGLERLPRTRGRRSHRPGSPLALGARPLPRARRRCGGRSGELSDCGSQCDQPRAAALPRPARRPPVARRLNLGSAGPIDGCPDAVLGTDVSHEGHFPVPDESEENVMSQLAAPVAARTTASPVRCRARLVRTGALAGVAAASAATAAAGLAKAAGVDFAVDGKVIPLGAFAWWSLVGTALGVGLAAAVKSRTRFVRITVALTLVSLLPAVVAADDGASKLALVATHLLVAAVVIPWVGRRLAVTRSHR